MIELPGVRQLIITTTDSDTYRAIDRAANRARYSIARELKRCGAAVTSIFHKKPERTSQLPSAVPDQAVQSWKTTDAEPKATAPGPRGFGLALALAAGWMLVLLGIVFLVAPGPGIPILVAGLALLARRYHWARRILRRLNEGAKYWLNRWKTKTLSRSETKRTPELPDRPAQMPP